MLHFTAYKEEVQYDSPEQPLYIRDANLSMFPDQTFPCHWHDDVEFLYVRSGEISYQVDGRLYPLHAGEGIFVNSQRVHYLFSPHGKDGECLCIILPSILLCALPYTEKRFIAPVLENDSLPALILRPDVPWMRRTLELLLEIDRIYKSGEPSGILAIQGCYAKLWQLIFLNQPVPGQAARHDKSEIGTLKTMLDYIHRHSGEKILLSEIARAGSICESGCHRLFRKILGRTPVEYMTEYRLSLSCALLRETTLSMTEIAGKTGFSSASYFAETFRKHYGCTPSEFKKQSGHDLQKKF